MKHTTLLLTVLLASLSLGAAAQETDGASTTGTAGSEATGAGSLTDQDVGGSVGGASSLPGENQTFADLDTNASGVLEESELEEANLRAGDVDKDGDGDVESTEFIEYMRQHDIENAYPE